MIPSETYVRRNYKSELFSILIRRGSGVELRILAAVLKPWASFFHSTLLQFTQLNKNEYLAIDNGGYVYEQPLHINCTIWLDASQRSRDGV